VLVQRFADTVTPEQVCQWNNEDAISKAKRQYVPSPLDIVCAEQGREMQELVDFEKELWDKIDD
jgi:hypothetical protein